MATALLTIAGGAISNSPFWSAVGAAAGAALGNYVDNTYIWPPEAPDIKRIEDVPFQSANEGSLINVCYGPESRIAGTVLWMSEIRARAKKKKTGGSGGGTKVTVGYIYSVDVAVAICEGEINNIKKIWAEGKIIYADQDDVDVLNSTVLACETRIFSYYRNTNQDYLTPYERRRVMRVTSPDGGPDLSVFRSGLDTVTSGWANAGNNDRFICLESGDDPTVSGGTYLILLDVSETTVTEAAGNSVSITQVILDLDPSMADGVEIHNGSSSQVADSLIEAAEGSGNVPGFRGISYVVFENLKIADWGNRPPQFNFLVQKEVTTTVADTIDDILSRTVLDPAEYDTSAIASVNLRGYTLSGPKAMRNALEPLMVAYDLVAQENDGVLYFMDRADTTIVDVETEQLAAHEEGSETARPIEIEDVIDIELPTEVNVQFLEPGLDYLQGSQRERKITDNVQDNILNSNLPLVLTAPQAREIAKRILWMAWTNRQGVKIMLPPSYFHILENDRVRVTANSETYVILVRSVTRGHNRLMEIQGVIEDTRVLTQEAEADNSDIFATELYVPPSLRISVIDIAPLQTQDVNEAGVYWGAWCEDERLEFPGGSVYVRKLVAGGSDFRFMKDINAEMSYGETLEALPDGITGIWDTVNVIKVRMWQGVPFTDDEEAVLDGMNMAVIGNEIIAFRDVNTINDRDYELSHLLRGLRNTEKEAGVHETRERFILLNEEGVEFQKFGTSQRRTVRSFLPLSIGQEASARMKIEYRELGLNTLRCFSPCHVKAKWADIAMEDYGLYIFWIRRTRDIFSHFVIAPENTPLLEVREIYRVQILDAPGGNVVEQLHRIPVGLHRNPLSVELQYIIPQHNNLPQALLHQHHHPLVF